MYSLGLGSILTSKCFGLVWSQSRHSSVLIKSQSLQHQGLSLQSATPKLDPADQGLQPKLSLIPQTLFLATEKPEAEDSSRGVRGRAQRSGWWRRPRRPSASVRSHRGAAGRKHHCETPVISHFSFALAAAGTTASRVFSCPC